jgi:hypothetical protein
VFYLTNAGAKLSEEQEGALRRALLDAISENAT